MGFRQKLSILLLALAALLAACSQVAQPAPVSSEPPTVVITGPAENQVVGPNLVLQAIASSGNRIVSVTYSLDGGPAHSVEPQSLIEIPLRGLSEGPHQVRLTVRDELGLETSVTRTFVVAPPPPPPDVDFAVGFEPTAFGFEIEDDQTIVVASHTATFINKVDTLAAFVEGYSIEYVDQNGAPFIVGDSVLNSRGSLAVYLPASTEPVVVSNFISLPAAIVFSIIEQNPVGAHANVYFEGTDVLGREFMVGPFQVAIVLPVAN